MNAKQRFSSYSDSTLLGWWSDYGRWADVYRDAPRKAARAELLKRGLPAKAAPSYYPRPRGYDTPSGYMKFWGLWGVIK